MPKLVVALLLTIVLSLSALAMAHAEIADFLSAIIALVALLVSVIAAFKEEIFPFRPRVLLDEVILAAPTGPTHDSPTILLPIAVINDGYGSGIIEGFTLKVTTGANSKVYTPIAEIDHAKFISGHRALHADNMIGAFNIFPLGPRASTKKWILFTQEEQSVRYPFSAWSPGEHVFCLFIKHTSARTPIEAGRVTNQISANLLADYKAGTTCSLSPGRELLV